MKEERKKKDIFPLDLLDCADNSTNTIKKYNQFFKNQTTKTLRLSLLLSSVQDNTIENDIATAKCQKKCQKKLTILEETKRKRKNFEILFSAINKFLRAVKLQTSWEEWE